MKPLYVTFFIMLGGAHVALYGQYLVRDVYPGTTGSNPAAFTASHGRMYFVTDPPGSGYDADLWFYSSGFFSFS